LLKKHGKRPRIGGDIPAACSFIRPASLIQSVVQGGESRVSKRMRETPRARNAQAMSLLIVVAAGQPL
jgi:hypothetical protein